MTVEVGRRPDQVLAVDPEAMDPGPDVGQDLEHDPALAQPDDRSNAAPVGHDATVIARSGRRRNGGR